MITKRQKEQLEEGVILLENSCNPHRNSSYKIQAARAWILETIDAMFYGDRLPVKPKQLTEEVK